jgi:hypothetical protein
MAQANFSAEMCWKENTVAANRLAFSGLKQVN